MTVPLMLVMIQRMTTYHQLTGLPLCTECVVFDVSFHLQAVHAGLSAAAMNSLITHFTT